MMATNTEINNRRNSLLAEWSRGPAKNMAIINEHLDSVKLALSQVSFHLDTSQTPSSELLVHCRDILEVGTFFSIETRQIPAFERYLAQLKCYYFDFKDLLPESSNKYQLLGLNLLRLLSQNRLAEFHTEVELLPPDVIQTNAFISHPVLLEQYLMEGSYNKVFLAKSQVPSPYYTYFIDLLLDTIRVEVASCLESAFDTIGVIDAARLLFLNDVVDNLKKFSSDQKWNISPDGKSITFTQPQEPTQLTAKVASQQIASQIVEYALELEKIV